MKYESANVAPKAPSSEKAPLDGVRASYTERGLLERSSYDAHILKSLLNDPNLDVSEEDGAVVSEYLERLTPEYRAELAQLIADAPPFGESTRLSFAVPAYKEGPNIHKTLTQYASLNDLSQVEVIILENHPSDTARDTTAEEISRFKAEHPELQVVHLYKTFDEKRIGQVRKYLTDSILERKHAAGRTDSTVIASNDADLEAINPEYGRLVLKAFNENPSLDALRGNTDLPKEAFSNFPLMHATLRFMDHFRTIQRTRFGGTALNGRNTAMRSGVYAAIGGYNERALVGEDIEIGSLIRHARKDDTSRMQYLHSAWIESNPRREIESVLTGVPLINRYDGFVGNERVYDLPIEELMREGKDFSPEQFSVEIQALYEHYRRHTVSEGGWMPDEVFEEAFDRTMRFMRIGYRNEGNQIIVEDLTRLMADLEQYRTKRAA